MFSYKEFKKPREHKTFFKRNTIFPSGDQNWNESQTAGNKTKIRTKETRVIPPTR